MFKSHYYSEEEIQKFEKDNGCKLLDKSGLFYVDIDFNKVTGFEKLSDRAKEIFISVYKKHNSSVSLSNKHLWIPQSVKEHKTYLEVHFSNKKGLHYMWLHYMPNGEWY